MAAADSLVAGCRPMTAYKQRVALVGADSPAPIDMTACMFDEPATGLPIVEYQHTSMATSTDPTATLLCFAGGGCSGASLATLAAAGAQSGIRVVSFDMPGHTPRGLLGHRTPQRRLISRTPCRTRAVIATAMVRRWAALSTRLDVLTHSAGFADLGALDRQGFNCVARSVICGAPIPGLAAMVSAARSSTLGGSAEPLTVLQMIRTRQVPVGLPSEHYGPGRRERGVDEALASYQSPEHVSVPLSLLSSRCVRRQDWKGRDVVLVGSPGDAVAPIRSIVEAADTMRAWGANAYAHILSGWLPHMFLAFDSAARAVADIVAQTAPPPTTD